MQSSKRLRWLPVLMVFLIYAIGTATPWGVALEERLGLEALFRWRGERPAPTKVAVIAITRESALELGLSEKLYEWSRQTHAQAVEQLQQLGARFIVFDIFFEHGREEEGDAAFEAALQHAGNVLLFARSDRVALDWGGPQQADQHTLMQPFEPFAKAALITAPLILPKIPARVNRFFLRHPVLQQQMTLPMLAYQMTALSSAAGFQSQPSAQVSQYFNFYGPPRSLPTVDYATLMKRPQQVASLIKDAVVFVGFSAQQQPDQRDGFYTAFTDESGMDISGVELAATAYANLVDDSWLRPLPWYVSVLWIAGYGWLCFMLARRLSPVQSVLAIPLAMALVTAMVFYLFATQWVWLHWCNGVLFQTPFAAGLGIWLRSRELQQQKQLLQRAFGKYLPVEEIDRLIAQNDLPPTREIHNSVCLVTDAQGYSRLSETLAPVELSALMQEYYAAVIKPIRDGGGLISDVAGDGVIALWPHLEPSQAWHRIGPVITDLLQSVDRFNAQFPQQALPTRVGLHAGEIVLGHFGAADHYEFRAMGDLVNSTSRLEGVNKQIGTRILISDECLGNSDRGMRNLGRFKFVGKDHPLRLFTVVDGCSPDCLAAFNVALAHFEAGNWQRAAEEFNRITACFEQDGPSAFYAHYLSESRQREQLLPFWQQGIVYLLQK